MPDLLLEKTRNYLRLGSEDNEILASLIFAAKEYLENAGVDEPDGDNGQQDIYELAVMLKVHGLFYSDDTMERSLTGIVLQLKCAGGD